MSRLKNVNDRFEAEGHLPQGSDIAIRVAPPLTSAVHCRCARNSETARARSDRRIASEGKTSRNLEGVLRVLESSPSVELST